MMRMSKAEDNSHPTSDADKPPPEKGDAEKNNPAQHEFARTQLKKAIEMATAFVSRLQPPPGNPKAMIYDLVCHTLGGLIWTLQQTKSDMQRGYCKLLDRRNFVEIEQAHFDTIIHQHHPEYQGEPLPLTQSRADILMKEIVCRVNELLGPLNKIKSNDARNDLHAEIERFTKQTIARYTVEPFGTNELVKEMAALQQLILRWIDRWQLPISPQNIAYHVHWAFKDYGETIRDCGGPLPPTADAMRPAEGVHYLESLIRRLEELGEQEYFNPDGDGEGSDNRDKSAMKATGAAKLTKAEANIKAREFLRENPNATSRELAAGIGCSTGLVSKLPAWQAVKEQRDKGRQPKKAGNIALTPKMEQVVGVEGDALAKLISEQESDAEPSPLVNDAAGDRAGAPRRAKIYRKP
jgi:hypothetical protein